MIIEHNPSKTRIIGYIGNIIIIIIIFLLYLFLNNTILLPYSYYICFLILYIIIIYNLIYQNNYSLFVTLIFYTIIITSIFSFRYGIYHGDSQNELSVVISLIRTNFLPQFSQYDPSSFPLLHIFTVSMGAILGYNTVNNISTIASYIPTITAVVCVTFLYLCLLNITNNTRMSYLTCIIWVSIPFINRWLIQYTRTTYALPFIALIGYLVNKKEIMNRNKIICVYIIIIALVITHPVVSFYCLLMLIYIYFLQHIYRDRIYTKNMIFIMLFNIIFLLLYWIYVSNMIHPFKNTISSLIYSFNTFFNESIFSYVITGDSKAGISMAIASKINTYFGLLRVFFFYLISLIGLLHCIKNKKINLAILLSLFGFIIAGIGLGAGLSSTTFYRVSVYTSFCICITLAILLSTKIIINKVIIAISIIFIILPTPLFIGEVVLPSDWLYQNNSSEYIDYENGETQRYSEEYLIFSALWIREFTPNDATIWSDGTHSYGYIKGYGERRPSYVAIPLKDEKFNIDSIYMNEVYSHNDTYTINYILLTELMKKCLYIPYGLPSVYPYYSFDTLSMNDKSNQIYSSNYAQLFLLI